MSTLVIPQNSIIDIAPVILLPYDEYKMIKNTMLYNYVFAWNDPNKETKQYAIALGVCQLINHSYTPNIKYERDFVNNTIVYHTLRDIYPGEELTVNYNGNHDNKNPVWFIVE